MVGRDWVLIILGAVGFIVLSHQVPVLRSLGTTTDNVNINLESIEGIDLQSLRIARQRGFA